MGMSFEAFPPPLDLAPLAASFVVADAGGVVLLRLLR